MYNYRIEEKTNHVVIVALNNDVTDHPKKHLVVPKYIDSKKVTTIDEVYSDAMISLTLQRIFII